jgi:hypothetical protein
MNVNNERFFDLAMKVIGHQAANEERAELDALLASQPELLAEFVRLEANVRVAKDALPLMDAMSATAGEFSPELKEKAAVVFALSNSSLYKHFLERFLEKFGRLLRLPWWGIHFVLYLATWTAFVLLIDVPKIYPNTGYFSFGGEQLGEFMFTTFMLFHIRQSRSIAILAAARIDIAEDRLIWLRKYLAPIYWGWIMRWRFYPGAKMRKGILRTSLATICVLIVYYSGQYLYYHSDLLWIFHAPRSWEVHYYPYQQLIYLYPTIAKAAMMVAGLGHFRWLSGLMKIVRGECPSTLNSKQRKHLYFECCQVAIRASMVVSAATAIWVVGDTLAKGFTFWSYLYSVWLVLIYAAQVIIIKNLRLHPKLNKRTFRNFFRELIVPDFAVSWQFTGIRRFATLLTVWGLIISPGPLAQLAAAINTL